MFGVAKDTAQMLEIKVKLPRPTRIFCVISLSQPSYLAA